MAPLNYLAHPAKTQLNLIYDYYLKYEKKSPVGAPNVKVYGCGKIRVGDDL